VQALLAWLQDYTGIGRPGPRKFIVAAAYLCALVAGLIARNIDALRGFETFAHDMVRAFGAINVFTFPLSFLDHMRCGYESRLGETMLDCHWSRFIYPPNYVVSLGQSVYEAFVNQSIGPVLLVSAISIATGAALTVYLWRRFVSGTRETNLLDVVGMCLAGVLLTTIAALGLQVAAVIVFFVFGGLVGLIILLHHDYRWVIDLYKSGMKLKDLSETKGASRDDVIKEGAGLALGAEHPITKVLDVKDDADGLAKVFTWVARRLGWIRTGRGERGTRGGAILRRPD